MTRFEYFEERFNELTLSDKLALYNDYCSNQSNEDVIYEFDECFINEYFSKPWDAILSVHYGHVNFTDEYVKFDGYGNLETLSHYELNELIGNYVEDIYDCGQYNDYIDMSDYVSYEVDEDEDEEEDDELKIEGDK